MGLDFRVQDLGCGAWGGGWRGGGLVAFRGDERLSPNLYGHMQFCDASRCMTVFAYFVRF